MSTLVKTLKALLQKEKNVRYAYLFGSMAEGGAVSSHSDVDIAVFLQNEDLDEELGVIHRLEKVLHRHVDLLVLNRARNVFLLDTIIRKGILLKDHPDRLGFEIRKWQEILDFKASRDFTDVA